MKETIAREVEWRKALKPHAAPAGNKRGARRENAVLQGLRLKMPNGQMDPAIISRGLEAVYDVISTDADFGFEAYAAGYADACEHFSTISDWNSVSEVELRNVMVGAYIQHVAALNFGEVRDAEFQDADKNVFRTVCSAIHELTGDDSENGTVAELEDQYTHQFPRRLSAAFYRMIAAIKPGLVVPVSAIARLAPVYAWLTGSETEEAYEAGWYELSRSVRAKLQELLPRKSIYQVGVFSWILAGAFRDDLENDAAKCRRAKVLESLRGAGLL